MILPPRLVGFVLAVVVLGGAVYVATTFSPPKSRRGGSAGAGGREPSGDSISEREPTRLETAAPIPELMRLVARVEGGGPVTSLEGPFFIPGGGSFLDLAEGTRVSASHVGTFVRAEGTAWARIPAPGADGVSRLVLPPAGPVVALRVTEASGAPAVGVPVAYGPVAPESLAWKRRTDADGRFTIDDASAGVLRVKVGGTERGGPTLRLVVGRDREVTATLDPPFIVTGRVLSSEGAPVAKATVRSLSPEGPAGASVETAANGTFRFVGRMTDRLSLVASASGFVDAAGEPSWPDPRGPLEAAIEIRLANAPTGVVASVTPPPGIGKDRISLSAEPAVLALARETYGPDVVLLVPTRPEPLPMGIESESFPGLDASVPVRVSVRGAVLAEDHVLVPGDKRAGDLRLAPHALPRPDRAAGSASAPKDAAGTASVFGRIADFEGHGLQGLTVDGGGSRTTTGTDGGFRLDGLAPGVTVDLVYAWLDGADPGPAVPAEFAPWFHVTLRPSAAAVALVLPKAASVSFRLLDGIDDRPLSWAHVVVTDGEGEVRFDGAAATRDGRATLASLVPGAAGTLSAFAPSHRRAIPLSLRAGVVVDAGDVRMSRGGRVVGTVIDHRGAAVPSAVVALIDDGRGTAGAPDAARERDVYLRRAVADAKGAFVLDGLDPAKPAAVAVWAPGFAPAVHRVVFAQGTDAQLAVTLLRGGRFVLRVVDPAGAPVSGASIDLVDPRTGARRSSLVLRAVLGGSLGSSDDVRYASDFLLTEDLARSGTYRVGPVVPGPYDLVVERPGFRPLHRSFNVPESVSVEVKETVGRFRIDSLDWEVEMEPLTPGGR